MINCFAKNLLNLRHELNLSQSQLAKELGVLQRTISHWENGRQECDFDTLIKLAQFFDVSCDYLLGYKDY